MYVGKLISSMADLFIFDSCVVSVYWQQSSSMGRGTWHYSFARISLWSPDFHVCFCLWSESCTTIFVFDQDFQFFVFLCSCNFPFYELTFGGKFQLCFFRYFNFFTSVFFLNDNLILASRFYICMELEAKPELLKHMQVYLELTCDGFFCCPTDKQTPV